jgi:hypothetical protein
MLGELLKFRRKKRRKIAPVSGCTKDETYANVEYRVLHRAVACATEDCRRSTHTPETIDGAAYCYPCALRLNDPLKLASFRQLIQATYDRPAHRLTWSPPPVAPSPPSRVNEPERDQLLLEPGG